ncbi:GLYCOGENIN SUBFAMILY MEMBER [Salix viminalis]|nr:GLYCOGENIN SUBFAMILY MEMBER [Salix viminalis]
MASSQEPWLMLRLLLVLVFAVHKTTAFGEVMRAPQMEQQEGQRQRHKNAYATMMYMGTPRDYEFYVAIRVLLRSLARLQVDADLVVIASQDVPLRWVHTM